MTYARHARAGVVQIPTALNRETLTLRDLPSYDAGA